MKALNQKIGYLKYEGDEFTQGTFDMKKSAEALLGFDGIIRYLISQQEPLLKDIEFDIPVKIEKGSWEIVLLIASGAFGNAFLASLGNKVATDGFLETGPVKDVTKIIKGCLITLQFIIKIRKHIGSKDKSLSGTKFKENNQLIGIPNSNGELLYVDKKFYDAYIVFPEKLFQKNSGLISPARTLKLGVIDNGKVNEEAISEKEKDLFYEVSEAEDIILPELVHGMHIKLEGEITRTTESTNTIGFKYNGHTLVCKPISKPLTYYKDNIISNNESDFFSKVLLTGVVDRFSQDGDFKEKKPTIYFEDINEITGNNGLSIF